MSNVEIANELSTWIFIGCEVLIALIVISAIIGALAFGASCVFGFIKERIKR